MGKENQNCFRRKAVFEIDFLGDSSEFRSLFLAILKEFVRKCFLLFLQCFESFGGRVCLRPKRLEYSLLYVFKHWSCLRRHVNMKSFYVRIPLIIMIILTVDKVPATTITATPKPRDEISEKTKNTF